MIDNLQKLLYLLTPQERKSTMLLLGMILIVAIFDIIGIASILPFIAVLSNPDVIESNTILNNLFKFSKIFGIETKQQFLLALGISFFFFLIFAIIFRALATYIELRFTYMREHSISRRLVQIYLSQPYVWFLSRNSSEIGKTILSEVTKTISGGMLPALKLINCLIISFLLIVLLFLVDPKLAMFSILTLGVSYLSIYMLVRSSVRRVGEKRFIDNQFRFSSIYEAFGAAKEVKVSGLEQVFVERFSKPAKNYAKNTSFEGIISEIPRYALEAISFGGMLLVILYLMIQSSSFTNILPIIALYAFAGYRLIPALQQIYAAITSLRFNSPAINSLYTDMKNIHSISKNFNEKKIVFDKTITLSRVDYRYPDTSKITLKNINLSIGVNTTVGFVGPTGSGKTTLVDIILGLLEAQQGTLEIDQKVINKSNVRSWQSCIGYVPQQIFLSDNTVAANIAFGTDIENIDLKAVEKAARIANIHEFIDNELPKKYQTTVGERGVRLSGGQRQRIGIARALYNNPKVLIFDEATSALDNITEQEVMKAINNLHNKITIIMIAHRLSSLNKCDNIFLLNKGELKAQGNFEQLIQKSDHFKKLAKKQ